jgi:hypothetical protein
MMTTMTVHRLIPIVGPAEVLKGPVAPTPQHKVWPAIGELLLATKIIDNQKIPLSLAATDARGNPAALPAGSITWGVDNPAVIALTPSADSLTCDAAAVGPLGTATVSVKVADAANNTIAAGTLAIEVDAGAAVNINIVPGTPVSQ